MASIRASAVIAAAGQGKRFGKEQPKQFLPLFGKPVLAYSVETFSKSGLIEEIILVVPGDWTDFVKSEITDKLSTDKKYVSFQAARRGRTLNVTASIPSPGVPTLSSFTTGHARSLLLRFSTR